MGRPYQSSSAGTSGGSTVDIHSRPAEYGSSSVRGPPPGSGKRSPAAPSGDGTVALPADPRNPTPHPPPRRAGAKRTTHPPPPAAGTAPRHAPPRLSPST